MPGLAGLISRIPREAGEQRVEAMCRTILHEPFYRHGLHAAPDMHTYVGWTCHRNSFPDGMPVFNEGRDVALLLAGEVVPDPAQHLALRRRGHRFDEGEAAYLVHLYEEQGDGFFERLNGHYAGVLIDLRRRKTHLFNDRFGMHRLFCHQGKEGFYFSSEAKAILAVLPETREFDPRGLVELLSCGCTLDRHSLFKGIEVLPGGSLCTFTNGRLVRRSRYFDHGTWESQERLSGAEFTSQLIELLPRVSRRYTVSRAPVGISLTGGFDSRMVMASLDPEPGSLPCYSFGSMYRDTFDVKVARRVAGACGQSHHVLTLGKEFISDLMDNLEKAVFVSDGYLGLTGAAELYANSLARGIAPVRLTGNWGSELLRGVRAFKFIAPAEGMLHPDLKPYVQETRDTFQRLNKMHKTSFVTFQQAPHQSYGRLAIERSQVVPRTPFLDNDLVKLMFQAPAALDGFALSAAIIAHGRPDLLRIPTDRGFLGAGGGLSKACRRAYRQALFKSEYWVGHGAPDWLVGLSGMILHPLERTILGRHKFYHVRQWIRDCMSEPIREILGCEARTTLSPYFDWSRVQEHMKEHFLGSRNHTNEMDTMLTLALIGRVHFRSGKACSQGIARCA